MISMNLQEFNENYLKLNEETKKAIEELEDLTGKDVVFRIIKKEEANTFFKLKIKLARKIMDNHIIIINEDNIDNKNELNYYIVHEIVHGLRLFKGDESYRQVVKCTSLGLKKINNLLLSKYDNNLKSLGMDETSVNDYCNYLAINLFQLFTNAAVDARIELYIYENYPTLRKLQKQAQKNYTKEILDSFDKKRNFIVPEWILWKVNAMNYAYLTKITPIIGKSWISKANSSISNDFKEIVNKLMIDLETPDNGQITDIETLNNWANILGLKEYFILDDFENIDFTYIFSN